MIFSKINRLYIHDKIFQLLNIPQSSFAINVRQGNSNPTVEYISAGIVFPPVSKIRIEFEKTIENRERKEYQLFIL